MPHAELKYSDDLSLDTPKLFTLIEDTINAHDPGAGACKCRAYPTDLFHHTHALFSITMLRKDHRDKAFVDNLLQDLERKLKAEIRQSCQFSLQIEMSPDSYITNTKGVEF